ncbi:MAG: hypothetical protein DIU80_013990 [Chloroflexota bacterium]
MTTPDRYVGTWDLVPELSLYEFGPAPASGTYEIEQVEGGVQVRVSWTMQPDGPELSTAFGGPVDGAPQALPASSPAGAPDAFSLTRVDAHTLDSAALRGGAVVAYARRVASHDGALLAVVQEGSQPDGTRFRNFQVYRRRQA